MGLKGTSTWPDPYTDKCRKAIAAQHTAQRQRLVQAVGMVQAASRGDAGKPCTLFGAFDFLNT